MTKPIFGDDDLLQSKTFTPTEQGRRKKTKAPADMREQVRQSKFDAFWLPPVFQQGFGTISIYFIIILGGGGGGGGGGGNHVMLQPQVAMAFAK